jgi:hypothetical protein
MRHNLLSLLAAAALSLTTAGAVLAQSKMSVRSYTPNIAAQKPAAVNPGSSGGGYKGPTYPSNGGYRDPGYGGGYGGFPRGPGFYGPLGPYYGGGPYGPQGPYYGPGSQNAQQGNNRRVSGVPASNERRMVPDEVVIEVSNNVSQQQITALEQRHRLMRIESQNFQLTGTRLFRWRIPDRRSVANVVRALEGDAQVASAQPNYLFRLQENETPGEGDPAQYGAAKMRLPQAHAISKGEGVVVAVIDSAIDASHPELVGTVAQSFDTLATGAKPHKHGTAIASLIAAHGKLMGSAPAARILAIRAFDPNGQSAEGSTFNILKGMDFAAANGARIINMSFAGPADPIIKRAIESARKKNIIMIAAAGNAGANSPPLYPAADPNVIAVSATDAGDKLLEASNRGKYIAIAAPGAQILVAIPDGAYELGDGTSYSAAEVSGIVALMLEKNPKLSPDAVRAILMGTAKDLGPKGPDPMFGAGLVDALRAVGGASQPQVADTPLPQPRLTSGR